MFGSNNPLLAWLKLSDSEADHGFPPRAMVKITILLACPHGVIRRHRNSFTSCPLVCLEARRETTNPRMADTGRDSTQAPSSIRYGSYFRNIHSHLTPHCIGATWTLPFHSYTLPKLLRDDRIKLRKFINIGKWVPYANATYGRKGRCKCS